MTKVTSCSFSQDTIYINPYYDYKLRATLPGNDYGYYIYRWDCEPAGAEAVCFLQPAVTNSDFWEIERFTLEARAAYTIKLRVFSYIDAYLTECEVRIETIESGNKDNVTLSLLADHDQLHIDPTVN